MQPDSLIIKDVSSLENIIKSHESRCINRKGHKTSQAADLA